MGQYYKIVNLDAKQYLNPHDFDSGAKLMELASGTDGVMRAVACLITLGKPWFGQSLVVTGDYADEGRFVEAKHAKYNLYSVVCGYSPEGTPAEERLVEWPKANDLAKAAAASLGLQSSMSLQYKHWGFEVQYRSMSDNPRFEWAFNPKAWATEKFDSLDDLLEFFNVEPTLNRRELAERLGTGLRFSALVQLAYYSDKDTLKLKEPHAFEVEGIEVVREQGTLVPLRVRSVEGLESVELRFPCSAKDAFAVFGIKATTVSKAIAAQRGKQALLLSQ